ncbi:hypothetical protein CLD22_08430 [Rubrivivax gelatinosus]|nr:hypothetical protein [Rubrivivax gelatinosus]
MFIDYDRTLRQIEAELARVGVAMGIDWADESRMRALAKEVLDHWSGRGTEQAPRGDRRLATRHTFYGLVALLVLTLQTAPGVADDASTVRVALSRAFTSIQG